MNSSSSLDALVAHDQCERPAVDDVTALRAESAALQQMVRKLHTDLQAARAQNRRDRELLADWQEWAEEAQRAGLVASEAGNAAPLLRELAAARAALGAERAKRRELEETLGAVKDNPGEGVRGPDALWLLQKSYEWLYCREVREEASEKCELLERTTVGVCGPADAEGKKVAWMAEEARLSDGEKGPQENQLAALAALEEALQEEAQQPKAGLFGEQPRRLSLRRICGSLSRRQRSAAARVDEITAGAA